MASREKLGDMLISAGLLDQSRLNVALADQRQWSRPLGITLIKLGFVGEGELFRVLARQLDVPVVQLEDRRINREIVELVPEELARKHRCLPLFTEREGAGTALYLGMTDPTDLEAIDTVGFRTGHNVHPVLVSDLQIDAAIERSYRGHGFQTRFEAPTGSDLQDPGEPEEPPELVLSDPAPISSGAPIPQQERQLEPEEVAEAPAASAAAAPVQPEPGVSKPKAAASRTIVRALVQLLIDKGVINMDELAAHIRALSAAEPHQGD
jgi:hypothetical protein